MQKPVSSISTLTKNYTIISRNFPDRIAGGPLIIGINATSPINAKLETDFFLFFKTPLYPRH